MAPEFRNRGGAPCNPGWPVGDRRRRDQIVTLLLEHVAGFLYAIQQAARINWQEFGILIAYRFVLWAPTDT